MADFKIAPSILSADFARLGEEVDNVLKSGADIVHFDVMDNHFVPNLTIGPLICEALRNDGIEAPIDVHLMVEPVDRIIPDFAKAGASYITFHPEASEHVDRSLQRIDAEIAAHDRMLVRTRLTVHTQLSKTLVELSIVRGHQTTIAETTQIL